MTKEQLLNKERLEVNEKLENLTKKLDFTDAKITELINIFREAKIKRLLTCPEKVEDLEQRVKALEERLLNGTNT